MTVPSWFISADRHGGWRLTRSAASGISRKSHRVAFGSYVSFHVSCTSCSSPPFPGVMETLYNEKLGCARFLFDSASTIQASLRDHSLHAGEQTGRGGHDSKASKITSLRRLALV